MLYRSNGDDLSSCISRPQAKPSYFRLGSGTTCGANDKVSAPDE